MDDKKNPVDHVGPCIEELVKKLGTTKELFAAKWLREQMVGLVGVLQGKDRVKGSQQDLEEAINDCAILLPYITNLKDPIEKEDAFLKLAVEGGFYCARGIKRATNELIRHIVQKGIQKDDKSIDPMKGYEIQILQALQNQRYLIVQKSYEEILKKVHVPNEISQDIHGLDMFRIYLSWGLLPLTENEQRRVGIPEIICWEMYNPYRVAMYNLYKEWMNEAFKEVGHIHFGHYIQQMINENVHLTNNQKGEILEKFIDLDNAEETQKRFHNLMFVRLGVVRKKA